MFLPEIPLIDAVPAPEESKVIAALYVYGAVPPVASNETSVPVVVPAAIFKTAGGARLREGRLPVEPLLKTYATGILKISPLGDVISGSYHIHDVIYFKD
jgi:hypothetical protein